jgi:cyclophilin family peptidyl-prolyl cis-trans isomerase
LELELQFAEDSSDALKYMTVELDGENMPHAVLTFLSQVDQGLYNTGSFAFHHHGDHIVYGSPVANHLNPNEEESWQLWESSGVSQLMFHEYTDQVPHAPYTIGFSGRGPNLYFNVLDNTESHAEIRDPCFGKVTRGFEVIDRMHEASEEMENGDWKEIEPGFVAIRSIIILNTDN